MDLDKCFNFGTKLKRRELRGSSTVAIQTADLLRGVISKAAFSNAQELIDLVKSVGKILVSGNPVELSVGNIVRRVLFIVRQECAQAQREQKSGMAAQETQVDLSVALFKLLDEQAKDLDTAAPLSSARVKPSIIEEIGELIEEIKNASASTAEQAVEHIHSKETILTFGVSKTVTEFLREAAKLRKFEVIVAESAPSFSGQKMGCQLAEMGIETTVITDSAVFAMMDVVNKVIIGTHAVMANGGLIAHTGAHNIAVAAKAHSVPLMVVTGLYKLCPLYAFDQDTFNEQNAPSEVLKFEESLIDSVNVENPAFDYIPPELVSLLITNLGGNNPSYIYRLLADYYNPEDYEL